MPSLIDSLVASANDWAKHIAPIDTGYVRSKDLSDYVALIGLLRAAARRIQQLEQIIDPAIERRLQSIETELQHSKRTIAELNKQLADASRQIDVRDGTIKQLKADKSSLGHELHRSKQERVELEREAKKTQKSARAERVAVERSLQVAQKAAAATEDDLTKKIQQLERERDRAIASAQAASKVELEAAELRRELKVLKIELAAQEEQRSLLDREIITVQRRRRQRS